MEVEEAMLMHHPQQLGWMRWKAIQFEVVVKQHQQMQLQQQQ